MHLHMTTQGIVTNIRQTNRDTKVIIVISVVLFVLVDGDVSDGPDCGYRSRKSNDTPFVHPKPD